MYQTGEIRDELRKELVNNIDRIISVPGLKNFDGALTNYQEWDHLTQVKDLRKTADKNYWLLVHDKWVGPVLHTYIMVLPSKPDKFLGTQAWEINENKGKKHMKWCLPADRPATGVELVDPSGKILKGSEGAPLN